MQERRKMLKAVRASRSESAVGFLNPNWVGYEAAMNVAPIYAGHYRMQLSIWGFNWSGGKAQPSAAPQAAVLRAHAEGRQQEGSRLLGTFTAP